MGSSAFFLQDKISIASAAKKKNSCFFICWVLGYKYEINGRYEIIHNISKENQRKLEDLIKNKKMAKDNVDKL